MANQIRSTRSKSGRPNTNLHKTGKSRPASPANCSLDAFLLFDEKLNCVSVNSIGKLDGMDLEKAVLGKNIIDIIPDTNTRRKYNKYLNVVRTGKPCINEEIVLPLKAGEVLCSVKAFKAGNGLGVAFSEITARKRAEVDLLRSQEQFRSLIECSLEGIVILNTDGTFRYQSPSMERILGLNPEDRVGKNSFEFVHPDDMEKAGEAFAKLIRNPGSTIRTVVRGRHTDGSWRTLQVVGRNLVDDPEVKGIVANFSDVTDLKKAEEAARESEEKFRRLVEDMNDGYCVLQESRVVFANARSAGMFGYEPEEVIGRTVEELLPAEIVRELSKMRARRQLGDVVPVQYETVLVGKNGKALPVELGTRITNYEGKPALSVVIRDIGERKKVEEALRQSEEHYSVLVGNLADVILEFKDGVVTWCNDRAEAIYGVSKDELIGKDARFFYPKDMSPQEFSKAVASEIKEHGVFRSTHRVQWEDGTTVDVEYSISMIPDRNPVELVAIVHDITERKRMVEALRESEEQYSALVGNLADAVFRFQEGVITWCNEKIHEMLGYTKDEMIGVGVSLFVPGEDNLSEIYRAVDHGLKERGHFHGITQAKKKDGTMVDIEYSASQIPGKEPVELVGVARDITERRRMEEALLQSERNYRVLFETRLDGVFVIDAESLKVMFANKNAAKMYGFKSVEDVVGTKAIKLVHPDDRKRARRSLIDDVIGDKPRQIEEFKAVTNDDRLIWITAIGTRMEYEGRLAGLISVRDITERKRAEQEKQSLEQQLQLSGRLAAVGELAAGVAHELNNPLAAVQAFAQFLSSKENLDETVRSDVETIFREAQRATRITSNLLSFARRHKPEKNLIQVNDVIEKSLELHAYHLRVNDILVTVELARDLPGTMADFHQMQQVFINLITNAEHAMMETARKSKFSVKTKKVGGMIRATFADNGPGIAEENLKRIFDPFFTSKEVGKGTGLGLSICYGIVQEHGGQLYCRGKQGEGATFVVELPIVSEEQYYSEQSDSTEPQGVQNG